MGFVLEKRENRNVQLEQRFRIGIKRERHITFVDIEVQVLPLLRAKSEGFRPVPACIVYFVLENLAVFMKTTNLGTLNQILKELNEHKFQPVFGSASVPVR